MPTPAITEFTTGEIQGTGVFDKLMVAASRHLEREYKANRIKGGEYATVYLSTMERVMATALQFLLEKDKVALMEQEVLKATEEVALVVCQKAKCIEEIKVLQQQVIVAQKDVQLRSEQIQKLIVEQNLLNQKIATETAQIDGTNIGETSVIGRQNRLYDAQTQGYDKDAKLKVAKTMLDTWNIRRTTNDMTTYDHTNKLSDVYIGAAVESMLTSVGIAPIVP